MPTVHELKTWPEQFHEVWWNRKTLELRKDDRDYKVGDTLLLREWNPETELYSGKTCLRRVTSILRGTEFGLQEGYVAMSIRPI